MRTMIEHATFEAALAGTDAYDLIGPVRQRQAPWATVKGIAPAMVICNHAGPPSRHTHAGRRRTRRDRRQEDSDDHAESWGQDADDWHGRRLGRSTTPSLGQCVESAEIGRQGRESSPRSACGLDARSSMGSHLGFASVPRRRKAPVSLDAVNGKRAPDGTACCRPKMEALPTGAACEHHAFAGGRFVDGSRSMTCSAAPS